MTDQQATGRPSRKCRSGPFLLVAFDRGEPLLAEHRLLSARPYPRRRASSAWCVGSARSTAISSSMSSSRGSRISNPSGIRSSTVRRPPNPVRLLVAEAEAKPCVEELCVGRRQEGVMAPVVLPLPSGTAARRRGRARPRPPRPRGLRLLPRRCRPRSSCPGGSRRDSRRGFPCGAPPRRRCLRHARRRRPPHGCRQVFEPWGRSGAALRWRAWRAARRRPASSRCSSENGTTFSEAIFVAWDRSPMYIGSVPLGRSGCHRPSVAFSRKLAGQLD